MLEIADLWDTYWGLFAPVEKAVEKVPLDPMAAAMEESAPEVFVEETPSEVSYSESDLSISFVLAKVVDTEEDLFNVTFKIDSLYKSIVKFDNNGDAYVIYVDMIEFYLLKGAVIDDLMVPANIILNDEFGETEYPINFKFIGSNKQVTETIEAAIIEEAAATNETELATNETAAQDETVSETSASTEKP